MVISEFKFIYAIHVYLYTMAYGLMNAFLVTGVALHAKQNKVKVEEEKNKEKMMMMKKKKKE